MTHASAMFAPAQGSAVDLLDPARLALADAMAGVGLVVDLYHHAGEAAPDDVVMAVEVGGMILEDGLGGDLLEDNLQSAERILARFIEETPGEHEDALFETIRKGLVSAQVNLLDCGRSITELSNAGPWYGRVRDHLNARENAAAPAPMMC